MRHDIRKELKYLFEERAAIREIEGKQKKADAEKQARMEVVRYFLDFFKYFKL